MEFDGQDDEWGLPRGWINVSRITPVSWACPRN